jgi:hypothetical protein
MANQPRNTSFELFTGAGGLALGIAHAGGSCMAALRVSINRRELPVKKYERAVQSGPA